MHRLSRRILEHRAMVIRMMNLGRFLTFVFPWTRWLFARSISESTETVIASYRWTPDHTFSSFTGSKSCVRVLNSAHECRQQPDTSSLAALKQSHGVTRFSVFSSSRCQSQVLLVLDGVDALFEDRDGEARDNLLKMLSSLCAMSDCCHLRLLATSDVKLQSNTVMSFRNGTEKVRVFGPFLCL